MEVRIRHITEYKAKHFTNCAHDELDSIISLVQMSGGFYWEGGNEEFHSYQLVLCDDGAYAEILIGSE